VSRTEEKASTEEKPVSPASPQVSFSGFPDEALEFYEGLEADNSRTYWQARKAVYDAAVRRPMEALLAALEPELGPAKIFRPNRDVRFSPDKSPYKTHCGAVLTRTGGTGYVQVSADGLLVAAGYYATGSDQVERYRRAVADDVQGAALVRVVAAVEAAGYRVEGHRLKTMPRGYAKDHPRAGLLRHRTLYAARSWPPEPWLHTPECAEVVRQGWRDLAPLAEWLAGNVGPSDQAR